MATVKVRIAVAVDPNGQWSAAGWVDAPDDDMMSNAIDGIGEGEARYFLTAELAIPEPATTEVAADVEKP